MCSVVFAAVEVSGAAKECVAQVFSSLRRLQGGRYVESTPTDDAEGWILQLREVQELSSMHRAVLCNHLRSISSLIPDSWSPHTSSTATASPTSAAKPSTMGQLAESVGSVDRIGVNAADQHTRTTSSSLRYSPKMNSRTSQASTLTFQDQPSGDAYDSRERDRDGSKVPVASTASPAQSSNASDSEDHEKSSLSSPKGSECCCCPEQSGPHIAMGALFVFLF